MKIRYKRSPWFLFLTALCLFANIRLTVAQEVVALQPEQVTILQYIIKDRPILVKLLTTAGLAPVLSGETAYTLLAPPEQSLAALRNESPDKIKYVLSGYILKGNYLESDLKDGASVKTLRGDELKICRKDGTLVNGVMLAATDKQVRNGVIHELQDKLN